MHHANINLKKVATVILISEKLDYKAKTTKPRLKRVIS